MAGVPISAMTAQSTLSDTDQFPFIVGPLLGDNRKITWADLKLLLQTYGGTTQNTQTTNYANNNSTPVVITNHNIILTEGKYLLTWDASMTAGVAACEMTYSILYNTNSALTAYDASDVTLVGSFRNQSIVATKSESIHDTGTVLVVPAGGIYIVKVLMIEATGQSYTVQNRVLTALKTL